MKQIVTFIFFITTIQISCQENTEYLKILPSGLSLKDNNNEQGQSCEKDFDLDGKNDLVIQLFSEEADPIIAIYLSSKFQIDKSYQWFVWIWSGNNLSFDCNKEIAISGGMESQGIYQSLELVYSQEEKKMVVKSYDSSEGESVFEINSSKILK